MSKSRRRKAEKIRQLLATEGETVQKNVTHWNQRRYDVLEGFDEFEELREVARAEKEAAIDRLPDLIEQARESVEANGGAVYVAEDAADANQYIVDVAAEADTVAKSKSMTTEEIAVNEHLAARNIDVHETDLGEFVVQVAEEAPSHLVGPALHKSTAEIAELFNEVFEPAKPFETAKELTMFARDQVGQHIQDSDIGITGANFVLAESGTIVLITNEGNARKTAVTPGTHIAVAGIEKLIPSINELQPFVELISKTATGQPISQYVSLLTPPTDSPVPDFDRPDEPMIDADREFHLVLLDNGRSEMRNDEQLRETLFCIRCGACANSCANFQSVGGHAFGGQTYTGGIATGWEAGVHGMDSAAEFNDLCTGCSRCVTACPVKIDIPWINTVVRERLNKGVNPNTFDFLVEGLAPDSEPGNLEPPKRLFGNFGTLAKLGSTTAPLSNWLTNLGPIRAAMDQYLGVSRHRDLPEFKRETLKQWFAKRQSQLEGEDRTVVLYPDAYTNHVRTERGKAAVRLLEAFDCEVLIPDLPESGRAPLSQGMIQTAQEQARAVAADLREYLEAGHDVIVIEPSDLAMFRGEYDRLLADGLSDRLAQNSFEILEYVYGLIEEGAEPGVLSAGDDREVAYHAHCQQRTIGVEVYTEALLDERGFSVSTSNVECCGMAGSFGYKSEYYELSMNVGANLAEQFSDADIVLASGASCLEQLEALLEKSAQHPVCVLEP